MLRRLFFLPSDRDAAFDVIDTQLSFNTLLGGFIYAAAVEFGDEDVRSFRTYSGTWDPILLTQNLWASSALCIIGCKIGLVLIYKPGPALKLERAANHGTDSVLLADRTRFPSL